MSHLHTRTPYWLCRKVMQDNRARVVALVGLALEPYRQRILRLHKD